MPKDLPGGGSIQQLDACSQADPEFAGWRPTSGSVVAGNGIGGMSENGLYLLKNGSKWPFHGENDDERVDLGVRQTQNRCS